MNGRHLPPRHARRRDKQTIHLYALCWNEARMLPHFFHHYDRIVDQYFIADHGSTDESAAMLRRHPKVSLSSLPRAEGSFIEMATAHYNQCWKASRGIATWVLVINIDEHVYHPRLRGFLRGCRRRGVTVVEAEGYNMVANQPPRSSQPLWRTVPYGVREPAWDKPQIFDPSRIEDINFAPGRHAATPTGTCVLLKTPAVKLLHFKYLGLDYLLTRYAELRSVFPDADLQRGWGYQYGWTRDQTTEVYQRHLAQARRVIS
jgi:hypothetical protein